MNQNTIGKLQNLAVSMQLITVEDMRKYSLPQLVTMIANKLNELIDVTHRFELEVNEIVKTQNDNIQYLLGEGLLLEVATVFERWLDDGTFNNLINQSALKEIDGKIDRIAFTMPQPRSLEDDTTTLQSFLNFAKNGNTQVTIYFEKGEYHLNTCVIYSNTTIVLTDETKIIHHTNTFFNPETEKNVSVPILFMNAKPFDVEDGKLTRYNGYSNITIRGGQVDCYSALLLTHGKNILVENVHFMNSKTDHYIQIGGCQNVTVKNCSFEGVSERATDRQYVEMVQIDWMTEKAQPYWESYAPIFDHTVNDNIIIDGCVFKKGSGDYAYLKVAIGSHSDDDGNLNKNIVIKNCRIDGFEYAGVTLHRMSGVTLENNVITTSHPMNAIRITHSNHVFIHPSNYLKGGLRGLFMTEVVDSTIDGFLMEGQTSTSELILIGECQNVTIRNIKIKNGNAQNGILCRNNYDVSITGCHLSNTILTGTSFIRVTTRNNLTNQGVVIKNNISPYTEVSGTPGGLMLNKFETLFEGNVSRGEIPLTDSLDKFEQLRILVNCYGRHREDLFIVNNEEFEQHIINIGDDSSGEPTIIVIEVKMNVINDKTLSIYSVSQINVTTNGLQFVENSNYEVRKIDGIRKQF